MDVGAPSNFERMRAMYGDSFESLRCDIVGAAFDDDTVVAEIGDVYRRYGYLLDPHGAIAWLGLRQTLAPGERGRLSGDGASREISRSRRTGDRRNHPAAARAGRGDQAPRHSERLPVDYATLKTLLLAQSRIEIP